MVSSRSVFLFRLLRVAFVAYGLKAVSFHEHSAYVSVPRVPTFRWHARNYVVCLYGLYFPLVSRLRRQCCRHYVFAQFALIPSFPNSRPRQRFVLWLPPTRSVPNGGNYETLHLRFRHRSGVSRKFGYISSTHRFSHCLTIFISSLSSMRCNACHLYPSFVSSTTAMSSIHVAFE